MISIPVHMLAFSETKDVVRNVEIDISTNDNIESYEGNELDSLLSLVFKFGQNDFQPKHCYSVSVGDVAQIGSRYFMVMPIGWKELSKKKFDKLEVPTCGIAKNNSFIFENA